MTRQYLHRPDEAWIEQRYPEVVEGVDRVMRTVARDGDETPVEIFDAGVDAALQAAAYGCARGEPIDRLQAHLDRGADLVRQALTAPAGDAPPLHSVTRWISAVLLAGETATAADVGRRATASVDRASDNFSVMLAALARGDEEVAATTTRAFTKVLADPRIPPITSQGYAHLDHMGMAVVARNQAAFQAVARQRDAAVGEFHRRNVQGRRNWMALLDHQAAALLVLGASKGLTPPRDLFTVPFELLRLES